MDTLLNSDFSIVFQLFLGIAILAASFVVIRVYRYYFMKCLPGEKHDWLENTSTASVNGYGAVFCDKCDKWL